MVSGGVNKKRQGVRRASVTGICLGSAMLRAELTKNGRAGLAVLARRFVDLRALGAQNATSNANGNSKFKTHIQHWVIMSNPAHPRLRRLRPDAGVRRRDGQGRRDRISITCRWSRETFWYVPLQELTPPGCPGAFLVAPPRAAIRSSPSPSFPAHFPPPLHLRQHGAVL
jgi:hypothetical protein